MSDLALRGGAGRISGREWTPATSASSLRIDWQLSAIDFRPAARQGAPHSIGLTGRRWIEAVNSQLETLALLDEDWDTYGSPPPAPSALGLAEALLREVRLLDLPVPRLRGTSDGGVSIEWFSPAIEFAVEIDPECVVTVFLRDRSTGETSEGALAEEPGIVATAFKLLHLGS